MACSADKEIIVGSKYIVKEAFIPFVLEVDSLIVDPGDIVEVLFSHENRLFVKCKGEAGWIPNDIIDKEKTSEQDISAKGNSATEENDYEVMDMQVDNASKHVDHLVLDANVIDQSETQNDEELKANGNSATEENDYEVMDMQVDNASKRVDHLVLDENVIDQSETQNDEEVKDTWEHQEFKSSNSTLGRSSLTEHENQIRIVIVGKTGSGKSATGNTLLRTNMFESKLCGKSITKKCRRHNSDHDGRNIVVVDTPGLFDTELSAIEIKKEIIRCVHMSSPGPHVFLIVVSIGRFTEEEIAALNRLFDIFGSSMGQCSILVFTGLDRLERENQTIHDYINGSGKEIIQFVSNCQGRYFAINNVDTEENKEKTTQTLLSKILDVVKENENKHFTNDCFKELETCVHDKIEEIAKNTEPNNKIPVEVKDESSKGFDKINDTERVLENEDVSIELGKDESRQRKESLEVNNTEAVGLPLQYENTPLTKEDMIHESRQLEVEEKKPDDFQESLQETSANQYVDIEDKNLQFRCRQTLARNLESIYSENNIVFDSAFDTIQNIDNQLRKIRSERVAPKNKGDARFHARLNVLEDKLMKRRSREVKMQSKCYIKLMNDAAVFQRELTRKKQGLCSIM